MVSRREPFPIHSGGRPRATPCFCTARRRFRRHRAGLKNHAGKADGVTVPKVTSTTARPTPRSAAVSQRPAAAAPHRRTRAKAATWLDVGRAAADPARRGTQPRSTYRPRSAGFQTCCIADFQIGRGRAFRARATSRGVAGDRTARGFGNPRYSRLGSLRYTGGAGRRCAASPHHFPRHGFLPLPP